MAIQVKGTKEKLQLFRNLYYGQCFKYDEQVYMKTDGEKCNSVDLKTGKIGVMGGDTHVELLPVGTELIVTL